MTGFSFNAKIRGGLKVAIIGATGLVGRTLIKELERSSLPLSELFLYASEKSDGAILEFKGKACVVKKLSNELFSSPLDLAFLCAGKAVAREYAARLVKSGCLTIDNSSLFRNVKTVPLVIPEVNGEEAFLSNGLIANPNCSTIQLCTALKPLSDAFGLKRVIVSTYQAVSGAGQKGISDLKNGEIGLPPKKFPRPVYSDCIPHIDDFTHLLYTKEEEKIINETRKLLSLKDLKITATAVRVPVYNCHAESVNVELKNPCRRTDFIAALNRSSAIRIVDDASLILYPTARDANGKREVFVGRIRRDYSSSSAFNMWLVADNLLRGAASNAVGIAELFFKEQR